MADDRDQTRPTIEELRPLYRAHAALCKALANEHRQAIMHTICYREMCVSDIAAAIGISVHNVSQHLRVLKDAGLVSDRAEGTRRVYAIDPQGLGALRKWLDQFWDAALQAFAEEVERSEKSRNEQDE